ncbi:MAG: hypothetical protein ACYTHJ_07300 [Planctomycetota bacterium]|jgi:hypothetical protein
MERSKLSPGSGQVIMAVEPFDKTERDALLNAYEKAMVKYRAAGDQRDVSAARAAFAEAEAAEKRYYDRIHRVPMSTCPFCDRALYRTFDPFGLDGLWWGKSAEPTEPPPCPHFCLLRGAVNFSGKTPTSGNHEVRPGPEIPYVIPRILELESMVMVVSEISMACGYRAFPLAYFAEHRPPARELTADWARSIQHYTTTSGEAGWAYANDPWDFDLDPWMGRDKVRWCDPESGCLRLVQADAASYPYRGLSGARENIVIQGSESRLIGVPDGMDP